MEDPVAEMQLLHRQVRVVSQHKCGHFASWPASERARGLVEVARENCVWREKSVGPKFTPTIMFARDAHNMHNSVCEYFELLHTRGLDSARHDVEMFEKLKCGESERGLTDHMVNLVFRDRTLLKAAQRSGKASKEGKASNANCDEIGGDGDDDEGDDDQPDAAGNDCSAPPPPPVMVWGGDDCNSNDVRQEFSQGVCADGRSFFYIHQRRTSDADKKELYQRADRHRAFLRSLRGKQWSRLQVAQREAVDAYLERTRKLVHRLESQVDYVDYMRLAIPLLDTITELDELVSLEVNETFTLERSVAVSTTASTSASAIQGQRSKRATKGVASDILFGGAESEARIQLRDAFAHLKKICQSATAMYGSVRGSGSAVDNPIVPVSCETLVALHASTAAANGLLSNGDGNGDSGSARAPVIEHRGAGESHTAPHNSGAIATAASGAITTAASPTGGRHASNQLCVTNSSGGRARKRTLPRDADPLWCDTCRQWRVVDDAEAICTCPRCAVAVPYQRDGVDACGYDERPDMEVVRRKCYDPLSYALKWLRQVQGVVKMSMPDEVQSLVFEHLYRKCTVFADRRIVREAMSDLKLSEYYSFAWLLAHRFNEVPMPKFSAVQEQRLLALLADARASFKRCPAHLKHRSIFLSNPYFFRQAVQILGWPEYTNSFPLLEGAPVVRKHDITMRWIANDMGWTFFPSGVLL